MTEAKAAKKTPKKAPVADKAPETKVAKPTPKKTSSGAFAVIATGGKQYMVREGDSLKIEKLVGEHKEGDSVVFDSVLLSGIGAEVTLGAPFIKGASVTATLTNISRYKTVDVIKYKQKSRYFKKYGHRQPYFQVKIDSIK